MQIYAPLRQTERQVNCLRACQQRDQPRPEPADEIGLGTRSPIGPELGGAGLDVIHRPLSEFRWTKQDS
jgi:hypothetical protein